MSKNSQYIIQIWSTRDDPVISEMLSMGHRLIFSKYDAWYLSCGAGAWMGDGNSWCSPYKGWQTVYDNSPHEIVQTLTGSPHTELILGGEAALWTEQVDSNTVDSKVKCDGVCDMGVEWQERVKGQNVASECNVNIVEIKR